jgi:hypothetical protein
LRKKGIAVTFIVHASRGEETATTIRLSVVVAIAKGRALAEAGWQVFRGSWITPSRATKKI